jgi:hypothetical protein
MNAVVLAIVKKFILDNEKKKLKEAEHLLGLTEKSGH